MKARMIVIIGIALLILGFATGFRSRHIPLLGPPAPVKKWEFVVANSIVQNCTKPSSPFYNVSSYKCDHRIPDFLPEHSPAIDSDGTIYAGGAKGLYALHPDGTVKWFS